MLRPWRLNYVHDDCHCATADQGIKSRASTAIVISRASTAIVIICSRSKRFTTLYSRVSRCQTVKSGRQTPSPDLRRRLLSPSLNRRKGHPKLLLAKLLLPKLSQTRPLQNVQIGASCLPTTKDGPRTFWPSSSWVGSPHPTWTVSGS